MVKEVRVTVRVVPGRLTFPEIPVFQYTRTLQEEVDAGAITRQGALQLLEQMLMVRTVEEMIAELLAGTYEPLPGFNYIGPSHVSIGQEGTSVGSISALGLGDYITSSHRGHGDAIAKGFCAIKQMDDQVLAAYLEARGELLGRIGEGPGAVDGREGMERAAINLHVYRMIAELFGRADGYCRGVGGSMHIADFSVGHLGANAIVGGHMGIATGAGISCRYRRSGNVVLCLAGDGAYSNGISHESMNLASMAQFKNGLMGKPFGVPVIFGIVNNQYAMSGQEDGEITGIEYLARRAAAYDPAAMHAEVVDGMDVLAVREATARAAEIARGGDGPVLLEYMTYRFKGHSLHDPLTYRDREELESWMARDPIDTFCRKLLETDFDEAEGGRVTQEEIGALRERVWQRNAQMAARAAEPPEPAVDTLLQHLYCNGSAADVPDEYANPKTEAPIGERKVDKDGRIACRVAVTEALVEEMARDWRVVIFGEDIAEYGGAFAATKGMLEIFGRERLFNTSISESGMVGAAIGMAMTGLRPIVEIMYGDFILQAMDQIGNQAAKWSYMSGGQVCLPMVIRTTIGGGRGYAGQHSQSLESIAAHMPGLIIVAPSDARDAKGLLKSAIRDDNVVMCFEHQMLYGSMMKVPQQEYLVPLGKAAVKREGSDVTVVAWSIMVPEALKAAERLAGEGVSVEVIDLRTLVPLDTETLIASVKKTGRAVVTSQAVSQGSYTAYVASRIQSLAFDYLDGPVLCLGSVDGVSPMAQRLEAAYLPDADKLVNTVKQLL
ncbi:MAG: dehydrogenase E1 component subunit alpha/beta [Planctomycetia bacterium]|nr:dehydrogenase E1 component subunit alpha/beta [Planctomycetia bacterium]